MNIYETKTMGARIAGNSYVGRGIVLGATPDGRQAVAAYFIMGRSANSRNRVFTRRDGCVFTEPYDASKVEDPSLIIYAAVRELPGKLTGQKPLFPSLPYQLQHLPQKSAAGYQTLHFLLCS